ETLRNPLNPIPKGGDCDMSRWLGVLATVAVTALLMPAGAFADPDELMPCKIVIIKAAPAAGGNGLTKFVCKPPTGGSFALPSPAADPSAVYLGLSVDTVPPGNYVEYPVSCVGLGNPSGSKGYKCAGLITHVVLLKTNVVKGILTADFPRVYYGSTLAYGADVAIKLTTHGPSDTKNYCARFPVGSALKDGATQFKATNAPAPAGCS